jgi:nucleotide-binding universal stress UspA family protein
MKSLLVPIATPVDKTALNIALGFARLFDAHIECCYVRPNDAEIALRMTSAERWEPLQKELEANASKAHRFFAAYCRRNGVAIAEKPSATTAVSAAWSEPEDVQFGSIIGRIVERAWFNDVVVLVRSHYGEDLSATDLIGEVLVRTGRPVIIVANDVKENPAGHILVAWKPAPQAVRAVNAAIPLLCRAKSVTITAVEEGGIDREVAMRSASKLAAALAWHGVHADVNTVGKSGVSAYEAIMTEAVSRKADLLVMGGYGHSRTRELVFGGFTRRALKEAPLAVFLTH